MKFPGESSEADNMPPVEGVGILNKETGAYPRRGRTAARAPHERGGSQRRRP